MLGRRHPKIGNLDYRRTNARSLSQKILLSVALAAGVAVLASHPDGAFAASRGRYDGGGFFGFGPPPDSGNPYLGQNRPFMFGPSESFFWQPFQPYRPFVRKPRPTPSASYRTLCVRICDGYYFPISYATSRNRFKTDAAACQSMYPPGQADLYVHRTTGEDATQAVSLAGKPLAKESFAFAYRSNYDHACATAFRSGSGARIGFRKQPVPDSVVTASLTAGGVRQRPGQPPTGGNGGPGGATAATAEPGAQVAEGMRNGMRTIGPAYYYDLSDRASTGGEPAKVAPPQEPAGASPPVIAPDQGAVAASVLPNLLNLFRKPQSAPPPPPAE